MAKLSLFERRRRRVRSALKARGGLRPRLSIHRSGRHIYAQVIDDEAGRTVAAASSLDKDVRGKTGATSEAAAEVGKRVAERHQGRVRPRRLSFPRSGEGSRRRRPRRRIGVLNG
jgi:large subunit ribosomal protein L18